MSKNPIVILKDVCLEYGNKKILDNLSFDIYPQEIVSILGESGSGKSTILKLISNLIYPTKGDIIVKANRLGMSFQYPALFNSMTVWENVALALFETTDYDHEQIDAIVKESLKMVNMDCVIDLYPEELSGGMQKRVSIARTLALKPDVLLYDEPSTGLDPATAARLETDMMNLRDDIGVTSIVVTHVIETVLKVSDRILILDKGYIVWEGTKEDFLSASSPYPCSFRERQTLEYCQKKCKENKKNE